MNINLPHSKHYAYALLRRSVEDAEISKLKTLIVEAIGRMIKPREFRLDDDFFFSAEWAIGAGADYGLYFHKAEQLCIISLAIERSNEYRPFAFFPLSDAHLCCEYFVWLISHGEVEIHWSDFGGGR